MNEPYLNILPEGTIDIRPLLDDKRVLNNPHKGWYIHYVDNGFVRKIYRDGIKKGDYLTDLAGINHLYLRVDWSDIEPEEGKFRWELIDDIMNDWGSHDYRFSFRFCCFVPSNPYATPKWVRDAGANGYIVPPTPSRSPLIPSAEVNKWEPDYSDRVFLKKLENFISACAERYDGDPRVEFVDIGSFGTYGEGHTSAGTNKAYSAAVIKEHIDIHLRHFHNTTLIMNDDLFSSAAEGSGIEEAYALAKYAAESGMGARDDSICVAGCVRDFGYDTLRNAPFFDLFYKSAPVDLEFAHFHLTEKENLKDGLVLIEALRRTHATYAGFHHYPREWYVMYPNLAEYVANRIGYWYFPISLTLSECVFGKAVPAELCIENRGFARAYNPYTLKLRAVCRDGAYELCSVEAANLAWQEGLAVTEKLMLDFSNVPKGEYSLQLGLFEGERAIEFAVKEETLQNGYVVLGNIKVSERKNLL